MGRILALDYGKKRTGVAVSDPLQIIANALETVPTAQLIPYLKQYMSRESVDTIVVGKPTRMDGTPSETFALIEPFVARLRREFPSVEVVYWDERFTSVLAHRAMIDGGVKKMARRDKAMVDRISATIILQGFMENKKNG